MTVDLDEVVRAEKARRIAMVDEMLELIKSQTEQDINAVVDSVDDEDNLRYLLTLLIRNYFHAGFRAGDASKGKA